MGGDVLCICLVIYEANNTGTRVSDLYSTLDFLGNVNEHIIEHSVNNHSWLFRQNSLCT